MNKVFRTDVPGAIGSISRTDAPDGCHCYRGVGELAGQDECTCTTVVEGDGGPKLRARGPANADGAQAQADAGSNMVADARNAMVQRGLDAWKGKPAPEPAPAPKADANESELDRARREMNERNRNAWRR